MHRRIAMADRGQRGFTLVELMIAVAILAILVGILVVNLSEPAKRIRSRSEVSAMFAELHRAQLQYRTERGRYFETGASESEVFPTPAAKAQPFIAPSSWTLARVQPSAQQLACGYVALSGTADDDIPAVAEGFGMEQPPGSWYVLYARCDADGSDAVDGEFFASSVDPTLQARNESN